MNWETAKRIVVSRDGGNCLRCMNEATDVHHRQPRKMGGTSNEYIAFGLANLVSLCRRCHDLIHSEPALAYDSGWLVRTGYDPAEIPLETGSFTLWLTPQGAIKRYTIFHCALREGDGELLF